MALFPRAAAYRVLGRSAVQRRGTLFVRKLRLDGKPKWPFKRLVVSSFHRSFKLSAQGWSWGYCSAVTRDSWRWIVDAHREGRRYIVHSDELLSAFLELEQTLL